MLMPVVLLTAWMASQNGAAPEALVTAAPKTAEAQQTIPQEGFASEMPRLAPCTFEKSAKLVERKSKLPPAVLAEITRLFANGGGIADAGEFFESSDAPTSSAPSARFIRAYFVQNIWFIWFERGGIGLMRHALALTEIQDRATGTTMLRVAPGSHFVADLCAGSKAFLSGARSAG